MKAILIIPFILLSGLKESELENAINKSNFVAFMYHNSNTPGNDPVYVATEVFKGNIYHLIDTRGDLNIHDDRIYLVIAGLEAGGISRLNFPIRAVDDLSPETLDILRRLPCYDEATEKKYQNGICTREYTPICGCDNKVYGNICEMLKHGIVKFKPGECR